MEKISKFLGLDKDLTSNDVDTIVSATSFASMSANPLTNYEHWDEWGIRIKGRTKFMRRGTNIIKHFYALYKCSC